MATKRATTTRVVADDCKRLRQRCAVPRVRNGDSPLVTRHADAHAVDGRGRLRVAAARRHIRAHRRNMQKRARARHRIACSFKNRPTRPARTHSRARMRVGRQPSDDRRLFECEQASSRRCRSLQTAGRQKTPFAFRKRQQAKKKRM